MLDAFLQDNGQFYPNGSEHLWSVTITIFICGLILYMAKTGWNERQQKVYIFYIALFVLSTQLFKVFIRMYLGVFDIASDLPLHLCNMMPFIMPWILLKKWRFGWSILFFWICAGTFQSLITPTHSESFPHYESIRYWAVHGGLTMMALYGAIVFGWRLTWRDALRSGIAMNIMALIIYPINLAVEGNYLYLMAKPPGKTMYDLLGPWPWYILSLELVILVLFGLLLIPFYLIKLQERSV